MESLRSPHSWALCESEMSNLHVKEMLEALLRLESIDGWKLTEWNKQAEVIYELDKLSPQSIPEIVWHYLSDADIRVKEPGYGTEQIKGVQRFISER
jgi:hypothetical protein